MHSLRWVCAAGLLSMLLTRPLHARPIGSKESTMVMADFREGAMLEAQVFYAPTHKRTEAGLQFFYSDSRTAAFTRACHLLVTLDTFLVAEDLEDVAP